MPLGASALFANDQAVLDMHHAIREWQKPRIVRHNQHPAPLFFSDSGKDRHDRLTILAIQRGGRLVRKDDRRVPDNGARDRDALLFPAAEFARKRRCLVG